MNTNIFGSNFLDKRKYKKKLSLKKWANMNTNTYIWTVFFQMQIQRQIFIRNQTSSKYAIVYKSYTSWKTKYVP